MAGFDFTNFNPRDPNQWNAFKDYSAGVTNQISNMPLAFTNSGSFDPNPMNYGSSLLPAFGQFFPSGTQYTPAQTSTTQALLGLVNGSDGSGGGGGNGSGSIWPNTIIPAVGPFAGMEGRRTVDGFLIG